MRTPWLRSRALRLLCCLAWLPSIAGADPCQNPALSPCFDANELWLPAGPAQFVSMPSTALEPRRVSLGLAQELLHAPLRARVNSPDPSGREVRLIDYAFDTSLFVSANPLPVLATSLVLPVRSYETGAGPGALTTQSPAALAPIVLRDPRIGLAYSFDRLLGVPPLGLLASLDVSLPLGDSSTFAGDRWLVLMPRLFAAAHFDRFAAELGLGARLREASTFGDVRIGNQGFLAAGVGGDAIPHGLLFVAAEAWLMPSLTNSSVSGSDTSWTVAEWELSAQSRFTPDSAWSLQLAGGGGIPLSSAKGEHFAGATTPAYRFLAYGRYAFSLGGN